MAINIGDALLKIGVDKKGFDRDMKGLSGAINKHKKAIGVAMVGMGVAVIGGAMASIKAFADMGDAVHKMALRTEFSTEALSEWKHVAEISGTSLTSLEKGVKKMSKTIVDASDGMATYVRSFDRIGLSAEQLLELAPEEQFETIMLAIADLESPTLQAATAQDIFGRAGTELLPVMKAGAEGIAELRKEARDLGIVFDQEAAEAAAEFKDNLTRLSGAVNGVKYTLARELMPAMEAGIPLLEQWAVALGPIIENTLNWRAAQDSQLKMDRAWRDMQHQRFLFGNNQNNQYEQSIKLLESMLKNQGLWTDEQEAVIERLKEEIKFRKEHTEAVEDGTEALEDQVKAYEKVSEQIEDIIKDMEYEESAAGFLKIGFDDLIVALHKMGKTNEEISETLVSLGDEGDNVLAVMDAFDVSVLDVAKALDIQIGSIGPLTGAYKKWREEIDKTKEALEEIVEPAEPYETYKAGPIPGGYAGIVSALGVGEAVRMEQVIWGITDMSRILSGIMVSMFGRVAALAKAIEMGAPADLIARLQKYQGLGEGGIAMRPMLARVAETTPEAIIPLDRLERMVGGKSINIYVELDGRIIGQAVGQPLVDEIRLKTGVHI